MHILVQKRRKTAFLSSLTEKQCIVKLMDFGYAEIAFFAKIPNFWACADKLDPKFSRAFGCIFGQATAPILALHGPSNEKLVGLKAKKFLFVGSLFMFFL